MNKLPKLYYLYNNIDLLKKAKILSDEWNLNYINMKDNCNFKEWLYLIAFINCVWIEKKLKFYEEFNNWYFII